MRDIKYLSPTSIQQWEENKQEFYLKYLSDVRPDRLPQTLPMSVGSAFDAYVKSKLYGMLFGKGNDKFEFDTLFVAQVEEQNRDFAKEAGLICFEAYRESGALADLLVLLMKSEGVRFEFEAKGVVKGEREGYMGSVGDVIFLGKPDAFFTLGDVKVILDWKVNGYMSGSRQSPRKGYTRVRKGMGKDTRGDNSPHKEATVMVENGVEINFNHKMEDIDESWAKQTAIYSWLCGAEVGSDIVVAIDNLVCSDKGTNIRVAEFRSKIGVDFQKKLYEKAHEIWDIVHSNWIFREMREEESVERCKVLDGVGESLSGGDEMDTWFNQAVRSH
jgi:hypothetical protein